MSGSGPIVLPLIDLKSDEQIKAEEGAASAREQAERDAMTDEERERLEEWESLSYTDQLHYSPDHLPSDEEGA